MYEDDWKFCRRGVRSVPVSCVLGWRAIGSKEGLRSERENSEESREGCSMEVESAMEEFHVREEVDEANTQ